MLNSHNIGNFSKYREPRDLMTTKYRPETGPTALDSKLHWKSSLKQFAKLRKEPLEKRTPSLTLFRQLALKTWNCLSNSASFASSPAHPESVKLSPAASRAHQEGILRSRCRASGLLSAPGLPDNCCDCVFISDEGLELRSGLSLHAVLHQRELIVSATYSARGPLPKSARESSRSW